MASDVDIVNAALDALGEKTITAFSDPTKMARIASRDYAEKRDALLQEHFWNFATRRATLAANATAPEWGFTNAYNLPETPKTLRVRNVNNEDVGSQRWVVEGRQILTNMGPPIEIAFIAQVTDPNQMTPLFRDALAKRLAMEWAEALTKQPEIRAQMAELYRRQLAMAKSADGQEGMPTQLEVGAFVDARFEGSQDRGISVSPDPVTWPG